MRDLRGGPGTFGPQSPSRHPPAGPKTERPYLLRGRLMWDLLTADAGQQSVSTTTGAVRRRVRKLRKLDHPKVVYLHERDLLPHLDDWLGELFDPERMEAILGLPLERRRRRAAQLPPLKDELRHVQSSTSTGSSSRRHRCHPRRRLDQGRRPPASYRRRLTGSPPRPCRGDHRATYGSRGARRAGRPARAKADRARFYEEVGVTGTFEPRTPRQPQPTPVCVWFVSEGGLCRGFCGFQPTTTHESPHPEARGRRQAVGRRSRRTPLVIGRVPRATDAIRVGAAAITVTMLRVAVVPAVHAPAAAGTWRTLPYSRGWRSQMRRDAFGRDHSAPA